jgi:predicted RecB family nuclease
MINDEIIESLLNCKYKAYRKLNSEHGIKKEFELLQREQLSSCKTEFYNRLLEKHSEKNLLRCFKFENNLRFPKVNFLIQPTLNTETFQVGFDAVEIIPNKNYASKKLYIPISISPKERFSKIDKLSLAIKCVILSQVCEIDYEFGRIIYGSELKTLKFKIEPLLTEAKKILTELHKISSSESLPFIYQKNHCKICEFQEACQKELLEKDSLGLLHRMDEKDIKKYNNKGLFTVKQLSYTFRPRKRGKRVKTRQRPYYFSLQALAIREHKVYLYDKISMPNAKTKVFIDMEGDSYGNFIYLIGILVVEGENEKKYSLWANNLNDEKGIFDECIKILNGLNDAQIFYFGKYESRVFKRMLKCNLPNKVKDLILNKSTNILTVIYSNLYFPTYSNSLKEIGKYLGCTWSAPNPSGIQSIVWRKKWESSNDAKLKDALIRYNYEDCVALKIVTVFVYAVFNRDDAEKYDNDLQNVAFVKDIKSDDEKPQLPLFGDLEAVSKDIEVINKCAYFEYQRNKIFFRTNKNIRKISKRKAKLRDFKYKANKIIYIKSYKCPYCKSKDIVHDKNNFYGRICFDSRFLPYGMKRWITVYRMPFHRCCYCKNSFMPKRFMKLRLYARRSKTPKKYLEQKGF